MKTDPLSSGTDRHQTTDELVIVNGQYLYEGHKDAWRSGTVVPSSVDDKGAGIVLVTVEHPPRGRERKSRRVQWPVHWLLRDTPGVRTKLASVGIDPEKPR